MSLLTELQQLPYVKVILSDEKKIICSVRISIERLEQITSGSMLFHHPRYLEIGQLVIFTKEDINKNQGGALCFDPSDENAALEFIRNIGEYIPHGKEPLEDSIIIEQIV